MDDPTSSLDTKTTHYIMENIRNNEYWNQKTFVITTNNLKMIDYADKIIHTHKGKVQFYGLPEEYKKTEPYRMLSFEAVKKQETPMEQILELPEGSVSLNES